MRQPPLDGSLLAWEDIKDAYPWSGLIVGNGLSINVWEPFRYPSLYREALRLSTGGLTGKDRALFDSIGTHNFELVLGELSSAIGVLNALGKDIRELLARYRSIQAGLGAAVRAVHVPWTSVPAQTLETIQEVLHEFEWVFSTSYDLLLYWAMGHEDDYGRLVDTLWSPNCRFDPRNTDIRVTSIPVYFLHGAMHLIVEGSGRTRKLKRNATFTLLDQFGQPIKDDPGARPLLVTEASSRDKLRVIEGNEYLAHAYETLQYLAEPIVVLGSSLGEQDRHLTDALSAHPDRPVAVSMMPDRPKVERRDLQGQMFGRLLATPLLFFDATTHPLGAADLAAESA
jgi:hypothetical protein